MFEDLTHRLGRIMSHLRTQGALRERDIDDVLVEIRNVLLEADVALKAVDQLAERVRTKATGQSILKSLKPGEQVVKIIHDEIATLLGASEEELAQGRMTLADEESAAIKDRGALYAASEPPSIYVFLGLQGAGKTTSVGKLAFRLKSQKKRVLVASLDVYRPAAREQLTFVAQKVGVDVFPTLYSNEPNKLAKDALAHAKAHAYDVLLIDTAGRLHVDQVLMDELKAVCHILQPHEKLLVADSLMGQDAARVAVAFDRDIGVTGVILTRLDGDGRGGAALSIATLTQAKIRFVGTGERPKHMDVFYPVRMAGRILSMGDVVSLVEKVQANVDSKEGEKMSRRFQKGLFDLNDLSKQLGQISKMGGLGSVMSLLPGVRGMKKKIDDMGGVDNKAIMYQRAIISSMTKEERAHPELFNASRRLRVAKGAGVDVAQVNRVLKMHRQMLDVYKKLGGKKGGGLKGLAGMLGGGGASPFGGGGPGGAALQSLEREFSALGKAQTGKVQEGGDNPFEGGGNPFDGGFNQGDGGGVGATNALEDLLARRRDDNTSS